MFVHQTTKSAETLQMAYPIQECTFEDFETKHLSVPNTDNLT